MVAISVCAALAGARGFKAIAEWAKDLTRDTRPTTSLQSRTISPPSTKISPTCSWKRSPPQHTTVDKGHGRLEIRRLWASTELRGYVHFSYAAQVFCIQRDTRELTTGKCRAETVYGVTSLSSEKADPVLPLCGIALNRHPWSIEDGLHYVRDMSFDEGRCRIRKHAGAHVMAALRNLAISLLRLAGAANFAPALRACGRNSQRPLRLLGLAWT